MPKSIPSFFFYDLETSGFSPRDARIMQFAGQRTDANLKPVGEPYNILIKLTPDVLPDPDAILVTGITPQATLADGLTEAEFLKLFYDKIATPDTIFLGYNSVRFDDEFMRFLHYRNFYDAYEWQWKDGNSRWDLLDIVRMTRALRPDGIKWPFASDGKASNRLELLSSVNKLDHADAHDALSDVNATIAVARLIKQKQPKLFDFLLSMRDKKKVEELALGGQPFIYTSGKYPAEFEKTTIVATLARHSKRAAALVYDLRHDPIEFLGLSPAELVKRWQFTKDEKAPARLPVKTLAYNRCPAVAPLGVLDESSRKRLQIDMKVIEENRHKLQASKEFVANVLEALELLDKQQQTEWMSAEQSVDGRLYDGFFDKHDCDTMRVVRAARPDELSSLDTELHDPRLKALLPLYKARNYPASLSPEEREAWDKFCYKRLFEGEDKSRLAKYMQRLQELAASSGRESDQYTLEELHLYAESIMPVEPLA